MKELASKTLDVHMERIYQYRSLTSSLYFVRLPPPLSLPLCSRVHLLPLSITRPGSITPSSFSNLCTDQLPSSFSSLLSVPRPTRDYLVLLFLPWLFDRRYPVFVVVVVVRVGVEIEILSLVYFIHDIDGGKISIPLTFYLPNPFNKD